MATSFYRRELLERPRGWAAQHLRRRGLDSLLASDCRWRVGYAPDRWSRLVDHLRRARFDDAEIVAAGLAYVSSNGYLVDRFRDRIVFAAHDDELRPVGFIGRSSSDNRVRYLNTRTTEIYTKAQTVVGLDAQLERLQAGAIPVFVEGTMDAPAVSLAGDEWAGITCCGTSISRQHALMARSHAQTGLVVVALDGNLAGRTGALRAVPILLDVFDEVLIAQLPEGQDPAALHAAGGTGLHDALTSARPLIDYAIEVELDKWADVLDHISGQVNAVRAVAPLVVSMPAGHIAAAIVRLARAVDLDAQIVGREVVAAVGEHRGRLDRDRTGRGVNAVDAALDHPDCSRSP